jgi:hypothetical protein
MAKVIIAWGTCLVVWFFYFQFIDWLFMSIQGLDYFYGLR